MSTYILFSRNCATTRTSSKPTRRTLWSCKVVHYEASRKCSMGSASTTLIFYYQSDKHFREKNFCKLVISTGPRNFQYGPPAESIAFDAYVLLGSTYPWDG